MAKTPYGGPYIDGSTITGMDAAYIDLMAHLPMGAVCKPYPPNDVINEVLAGNDPWDTLQNALADGSYTPKQSILDVASAYDAWKAGNKGPRPHHKDHPNA